MIESIELVRLRASVDAGIRAPTLQKAAAVGEVLRALLAHSAAMEARLLKLEERGRNG